MKSARMTDLPSAEDVKSLLTYEPSTGKLFWKARGPEWFSDGAKSRDWQCNVWNARFAGKEFGSKDRRGYVWGCLAGTPCVSAHSIVWVIHTGKWPENVIDHIDGDPQNNRIENLRAVSQAVNSRNCKIGATNTSGATGVFYDARSSRWRAFITVDRKRQSIGSHDTFEGALLARRRAEQKHGFISRGGKHDGGRNSRGSRNCREEMGGGSSPVHVPSMQPLAQEKERSLLERNKNQRGRSGVLPSLRLEVRGVL